MQRLGSYWKKAALIGAAPIAVAALVTGGIVYAREGGTSSVTSQDVALRVDAGAGSAGDILAGFAGRDGTMRGGPGFFGASDALAAFFGITPDQLKADLKAGKSLAKEAADHGKPIDGPNGLKQFLTDQFKVHLDKAVADKKMTAAQEQQALDRFNSHLDALVNGTLPQHGMHGTPPNGGPNGNAKPNGVPGQNGPMGGPFMAANDAIAAFFGITPDQLRSDLRSGKSLAQEAAAHGKNVADLKKLLSDQFKAQLDKAVAAGKLTAAQEQQMLDRYTANLDAFINGTFPAGPHNGGPHHGAGDRQPAAKPTTTG